MHGKTNALEEGRKGDKSFLNQDQFQKDICVSRYVDIQLATLKKKVLIKSIQTV